MVDAERALCARPEHLALVDAAFSCVTSPEATILRTRLCPTCPIAESCLAQGMAGEYGVWAGTTQNFRTRHGAPKPRRATSAARERDVLR